MAFSRRSFSSIQGFSLFWLKFTQHRGIHLGLQAICVQDEDLDVQQQMGSDAYAALLRQCKSLSQGKRVHADIVRNGYEKDPFVGNLLVQMYGKCGSVGDARSVFDGMLQRDVFSWNIMLAAYNQNGCSMEVLQLFRQMDVKPTEATFISVLSACSSLKSLAEGKAIHARIIVSGLDSDVVCNSLVNVYNKCGSLQDAKAVFDQMQQKDVVCWTSMVTAYAQDGHPLEALRIFRQMELEGVRPNEVTFIAVVGACSGAQAIAEGKAIHERIVTSGFASRAVIWNSLINMYSKCNSLDEARRVFNEMSWRRTLVSWTAMISAYARSGRAQEALQLYHGMNSEGMQPDEVAFISLADACSLLGFVQIAERIHGRIASAGFESNLVVGNALINMYAKCRRMDLARAVFDGMSRRNVISWTAMIGGYVQQGDHDKDALQLYWNMLNDSESTKPNEITFTSILSACSNMESLEQGKAIHSHVVASGLKLQADVATALVNMYSKCGSLEDARSMFDKAACSRTDNEALWNAMIVAYMQDGRYKQAIELFHRMDLEGGKAKEVTFASVIGACSSLGALKQGVVLHERFIQSGLKADIVLENSLLNMYGKCGSLRIARSLFNGMAHRRNLLSWNALIAAHAQHGHGKEVMNLFHEMVLEGVKPSEITFLSTLYACSHVGMLYTAWECFLCMIQDHGVAPIVEHYRCMIDLLGRAGRLCEAEDLINNMPFQWNSTAWVSFLGACNIHCNPEQAAHAAECASQSDPDDSAPYVLLSNIYSAAGWSSKLKQEDNVQAANA